VGWDMDVVAYLNRADLLLEDEQGVMIVGTGNYVLSLGDRVCIKQIDAYTKVGTVEIAFASASFQQLHHDQMQIKFEGSRQNLQEYLHRTTVH
jgi:hypothetical protein